MDLNLREEYSIKYCTKFIAVISHDNYYSFIIHFVDWCNNGLFPLMSQLFLIPNRINKSVDHRH
jgi:hypothetical protein